MSENKKNTRNSAITVTVSISSILLITGIAYFTGRSVVNQRGYALTKFGSKLYGAKYYTKAQHEKELADEASENKMTDSQLKETFR